MSFYLIWLGCIFGTINIKKTEVTMNPIWKKTIYLLAIFLIPGCDSDRFFGYEYSAQKPATITKISGLIRHLYTGEGVDNAQISVDTQSVKTNSDGTFDLNFILGVNEQFNKTYSVKIRAEGYYPLDTTIVIFPNENNVNYILDYGSPVVLFAELLPPFHTTATVLDYQGIATVDTVNVLAYFVDSVPNSNRTIWREYPMVKTQTIDELTAVYEGFLDYDTDLPGMLGHSRLRIYARDNEGFVKDQLFLFPEN